MTTEVSVLTGVKGASCRQLGERSNFNNPYMPCRLIETTAGRGPGEIPFYAIVRAQDS